MMIRAVRNTPLIMRRIALTLGLVAVASCGGGGSAPVSPVIVDPLTPVPTGPDFSDVDGSFQAFIDGTIDFDGISYVLVDADGIIHQGVFGDHTEDTVVLLASTSKVPAVMTLMALQEDEDVEFSLSEPVSTYLPYDGPYADRTVEQMVSNTSGIPGLRLLAAYGSPTGPTIEDFNHLCQYSALPIFEFEACGQTLVQNELPTTQAAGSAYDYGGSQWQIAGVTASTVANMTWNHLVNQYLGIPCDLEVFTFGNPWDSPTSFTGSIASLQGTTNPNIEGGAITNMSDYAKLLQVHLNGGFCGDTQVLSEDSIASMQLDRGGVVATNAKPYGMGWWIQSDNPGVLTDPGAFGAVSFIDVNRVLVAIWPLMSTAMLLTPGHHPDSSSGKRSLPFKRRGTRLSKRPGAESKSPEYLSLYRP